MRMAAQAILAASTILFFVGAMPCIALFDAYCMGDAVRRPLCAALLGLKQPTSGRFMPCHNFAKILPPSRQSN